MTKKVFIIAEAGVNHNGSSDTAKELIDAAVDAGADAVKFQTFKTELCLTKNAEKAEYQKSITGDEESQFEMIKRLELGYETHVELKSYCEERSIMFLSTPFDQDSIRMLAGLGLEVFKIPSGEITNIPYLRLIGGLKKKIILSTGMATIGEVEHAMKELMGAGVKRCNITVLHANTMYPTPIEDVNLRAMVTLGEALGVSYGYSDHTLGIEVDIAAVAMGAEVIEKHFTLDKSMDGPDHSASLAPWELKEMVRSIRSIELALGDGIKKPSPSEQPNIETARKSIVAKHVIEKGELLTEDNLSVKRPGSGISPIFWDNVIGSKAKRDYDADDFI